MKNYNITNTGPRSQLETLSLEDVVRCKILQTLLKFVCKLAKENEHFPWGSSNAPCKQLETEVIFPE